MRIDEVAIFQLKTLFMLTDSEEQEIRQVTKAAETSARTALSGFNNKYLTSELEPLNSVINCNYLYWLSHELYKLHSGGRIKCII